jgi:hypothetical protein
MSKSVKSFLSLLLVLQLIIPYSVFAAPVGEFTSIVGKVTQTRATELVIPVVKSPVQLKDIIITEQASSATMVFSDESTIVLSGKAKLEIKEFLFKDKSRTGIFSLAMGKVAATVSKYIGGDNVFEVQSPTAIVGVRGTGFEFVEAVNAENKNMATVSCTEGSLNLSALSPTGAVVSTAVLEAGQMAVIIGGVITISAITAAGGEVSAATASRGGAIAVTTTGATATAGISTTAIVGVATGVAAVGVVGAAAGGGGSDSTPATTSTPVPTPTPTSYDCISYAGNWAGTLTGTTPCGEDTNRGIWTMPVNSDCNAILNITYSSGYSTTTTLRTQSDSGGGTCQGCSGESVPFSTIFNFSGDNVTFHMYCGDKGHITFTGTRQ